MQFDDDVLEKVFKEYMPPAIAGAESIPVVSISGAAKTEFRLQKEQAVLDGSSPRQISHSCMLKYQVQSILRRLMDGIIIRYRREFDPAGNDFS